MSQTRSASAREGALSCTQCHEGYMLSVEKGLGGGAEWKNMLALPKNAYGSPID